MMRKDNNVNDLDQNQGRIIPPPATITSGPMLSEDFLWGFATASYQIEGAPTADSRGPSIWDTFSRHPGKTLDGHSGDTATDSYNLLSEDLDLLERYGARSYRFSMSWSRIIPLGGRDDPINEKGIEYYNRLIDGCLERGIIPFVTLYHWDLPLALHQRYGGWLNKEEIVKDFTNYARVCFEAFGDRVTHWLTFNEPWCISVLGYGRGVFAPGRSSSLSRPSSTNLNDIPHSARESGQPGGPCFSPWIWEMSKKINPETNKPYHLPYGDSRREPWLVGHHVILSHASAVNLYRTKYKQTQGGMIGITLNGDYALPLHSKPLKSLQEVLQEAGLSGNESGLENPHLATLQTTYQTHLASHHSDVIAAQHALDFAIGWFADPVYLNGDYPAWMREVLGDRLPVFTEEEKFGIDGKGGVKGSSDFYGMNTYTTNLCTAWRPTGTGVTGQTVTHTNANISTNSPPGSSTAGVDEEEFPYLGDEYQGLVEFTFTRPLSPFEPPAGSTIPITIPSSPIPSSSPSSPSQLPSRDTPIDLSYTTTGPGTPLGTQASCAWLQAYSPGFRLLLNYLWRRYKKPIYVTENGFAEVGEDERYRKVGEIRGDVRKVGKELRKVERGLKAREKVIGVGEREHELSALKSQHTSLLAKYESTLTSYNTLLDKSLHDPDRTAYFANNLRALWEAVREDGVDVRGYFGWSLMDNFEWADGYGTRFGCSWVEFGFEGEEEGESGEGGDDLEDKGEEEKVAIGRRYERREKTSGRWIGEWFKNNVSPNSDLLDSFPSLAWKQTQRLQEDNEGGNLITSSTSGIHADSSNSTSVTVTPGPITPVLSENLEVSFNTEQGLDLDIGLRLPTGIEKGNQKKEEKKETKSGTDAVLSGTRTEERSVVDGLKGIRLVRIKREGKEDEAKGIIESVSENSPSSGGKRSSVLGAKKAKFGYEFRKRIRAVSSVGSKPGEGGKEERVKPAEAKVKKTGTKSGFTGILSLLGGLGFGSGKAVVGDEAKSEGGSAKDST